MVSENSSSFDIHVPIHGYLVRNESLTRQDEIQPAEAPRAHTPIAEQCWHSQCHQGPMTKTPARNFTHPVKDCVPLLLNFVWDYTYLEPLQNLALSSRVSRMKDEAA